MIETKLGVVLTDNEVKAIKNLVLNIKCNDVNCDVCPFNNGLRCTMDMLVDIHDTQVKFRKDLTQC